MASQVHAMGRRRQRHVQPLVDDDARQSATNGVNAARDQLCEQAAVEVRLAHLNEMHAVSCRRRHLRDDRVGPVAAPQSPVSDETEHRGHDYSSR
jgi:hypothetical protein